MEKVIVNPFTIVSNKSVKAIVHYAALAQLHKCSKNYVSFHRHEGFNGLYFTN